MKLLWVLVNCNTVKEAKTIGRAALKNKLAACIDIYPRIATAYFWPPKSGKVESGRGYLLIMDTLQINFRALEKLIKKHHSDKIPFIGSISIGNVHTNYLKWLKGEIKQ